MKENLFVVRFAEPKDAFAISQVYEGWKEFKGVLPDALVESEPEEGIFNTIKNNPSKKFIIAETKNGEIVGVCYLDVSFISLRSIRLGDLMVSSEYRKNGVGSLLVDEVIKFARERNILKIWLWTQEELFSAIRLYEKKGFVFEGRQKDQFCGKDVLLYGLVLKK